MDYGKIVTRAFEITRKYRALWLFGVLLALFGGGGSRGSVNFPNFPSGSSSTSGRGSTVPDLPRLPSISSEMWQMIAVLIGAVVCFVLIWMVLGIILRFISRGALIGLVQELEANQTNPTVKHGFDIGAEHFWRLLGVALTINLPLMLVSFVLVLLAALPLLAVLMPLINDGRRLQTEMLGVALAGSFGAIVLLCCVALVLGAVALVIHPFYEFMVRTCVIDKRGVRDSIRVGYRVVRANLGKVIGVYVLAIGINFAFGFVMIPIAIVVIGIPLGAGVAVYLLANSLNSAIILGVVLGIPMLMLMLFISGLYQTFESAYWTLGYRAVIALPTATKMQTTPAAQ